MRNLKEWLNTKTFEYKQAACMFGHSEWIEIPEGAEVATLCRTHITFWKDGAAFFVGDDTDWDYEYELDYSKYLDISRESGAKIIWQRDQDEPFLTPECTLNDQYAEIEEVRRSIIEVNHNPNQQPREIQKNSIEGTLSERQTQYGCYEDVAQVTQQILSALRIGNYDKLPAPMKESLHMIASKMARIVNGDPEYIDNWHDIGGYAKLIEKLINGE